MTYYARVVYQSNASAAERHDDVGTARCWIEAERNARPGSFRLGQIVQGGPVREIIATFDTTGWHALQEDGTQAGADWPQPRHDAC